MLLCVFYFGGARFRLGPPIGEDTLSGFVAWDVTYDMTWPYFSRSKEGTMRRRSSADLASVCAAWAVATVLAIIVVSDQTAKAQGQVPTAGAPAPNSVIPADLPKAVTDAVMKVHPNGTIDSVYKHTTTVGTVYEVWVTEAGKPALMLQLKEDGTVRTPPTVPGPDTTVLTLLGTWGGPGIGGVGPAGVDRGRTGEASVLTVRGKSYLIDAGIGVSLRLREAGFSPASPASIPTVFITHLHNDHTAGLFEVLVFHGPNVEIIGPPRTVEFVNGVIALTNIDREIRRQPLMGPANSPRSFTARDVEPGLIYQDENVKVTAFENAHYHFPEGSLAARNRSYAYRFETPHKVIVFTGDTGEQPALAKFAEGADILVSEIVTNPDPTDFHMSHEHLPPTQVGQLARDAKVKMLVLSHIVFGVTEADLAEIRKWYSGPVVLGADLQTFK
jgi:ribonuclease BN (tRNA processing enzyme)